MARLTQTGIDPIDLSYLAWLDSQESARQQKYTKFRDYYEGDHATQLTARIKKFLNVDGSNEFNLNLCPVVVDSLAEKLSVSSFKTESDPDLLRQWWNLNRMDATQMVVHLAAIRDGDGYLLVEWDNITGWPLFTHENAYDGTTGVHVVYSDERRSEPKVAVKRWTITSGVNITTRRLNLYYADRIEKYTATGSGAWQEHHEEGQPWPIPWAGKDGSPLGIPIVHFRNKNQGYSYGESELEDVTPLCDALNKSVVDLLGAADTTGFQMITATGVPSDATFIVAPGVMLRSSDPATQFGTVPPADLSGLIAVIDSFAAYIAKITRTPLSYFQLTGQVAAAGTLKEQRAGLIAKARKCQTVFGNAWEDAMYLARRLYNTFGAGGLDEQAEISCEWCDDEKPEPRELAEEVELLTRAQAASTRQKVKTLHPDWSDDDIDAETEAIRDEYALNTPEIGGLV